MFEYFWEQEFSVLWMFFYGWEQNKFISFYNNFRKAIQIIQR